MIAFNYFSTLFFTACFMACLMFLSVRSGRGKQKLQTLEWLILVLVVTYFLLGCKFAFIIKDVSVFTTLTHPIGFCISALLMKNAIEVTDGHCGRIVTLYRKAFIPHLILWVFYDAYTIYVDINELSFHQVLLFYPAIIQSILATYILAKTFRIKTGISLLKYSFSSKSPDMLSRENQSHLSYVAMNLAVIAMPLSGILQRFELVEYRISSSFMHIFCVLAVVMVASSFSRYQQRGIGLKTKATTLYLAILTIVHLAMMGTLSDETNPFPIEEYNALTRSGLLFEPAATGSYALQAIDRDWVEIETARLDIPEAGPLPIDLQNSFPFFGKAHESLNIFADGRIVFGTDPREIEKGRFTAPKAVYDGCLGSGPTIAPYCLRENDFSVFFREEAERLIVTWKNTNPDNPQTEQDSMQLVITRSGSICFQYRDIALTNNFKRHLNAIGISSGMPFMPSIKSFLQLPIQSHKGAIWFNLTTMRRIQMHREELPFLVFLPAELLLYFVFHAVFRRTITTPLASIRKNVAHITKEKDLPNLHDFSADEITTLAKNTNEMLVALEDTKRKASEHIKILQEEIQNREKLSLISDNSIALSAKDKFLGETDAIIEENISNFDFQVAELASELGVSVRQLHRKFQEFSDQPPSTFIRSKRLSYGHQLLATQKMSISEVSYKCGFKDAGYFARLFQQHFGISPKELKSQKPKK